MTRDYKLNASFTRLSNFAALHSIMSQLSRTSSVSSISSVSSYGIASQPVDAADRPPVSRQPSLLLETGYSPSWQSYEDDESGSRTPTLRTCTLPDLASQSFSQLRDADSSERRAPLTRYSSVASISSTRTLTPQSSLAAIPSARPLTRSLTSCSSISSVSSTRSLSRHSSTLSAFNGSSAEETVVEADETATEPPVSCAGSTFGDPWDTESAFSEPAKPFYKSNLEILREEKRRFTVMDKFLIEEECTVEQAAHVGTWNSVSREKYAYDEDGETENLGSQSSQGSNLSDCPESQDWCDYED